MKLRVFFVRHTLSQAMAGKHQYTKNQESADFPEDTPWRVAYDALYKQIGHVTDSSMNGIAPAQYVTINSHTLVNEEREQVRLPEERMQEQDLLSPMDLKNSLGEKPGSTPKRKRRKL